MAIAAAAGCAARRRWPYHLVSGLPLAEAKNLAASLAVAAGRDLLLLEDDVLVPEWPAGRSGGAEVVEVHYPHCEGTNVYRRDSDGRVLYAGTCCLRVPVAALRAMAPPWFEAREMRQVGDRLEPRGRREDGRGSDAFFCYRLHQAGVPLTVVGTATVLEHQLRGCGPSVIRAVPL